MHKKRAYMYIAYRVDNYGEGLTHARSGNQIDHTHNWDRMNSQLRSYDHTQPMRSLCLCTLFPAAMNDIIDYRNSREFLQRTSLFLRNCMGCISMPCRLVCTSSMRVRCATEWYYLPTSIKNQLNKLWNEVGIDVPKSTKTRWSRRDDNYKYTSQNIHLFK